MSVDRFFEVPGLVVNDKAAVFSGDDDPAIPGLNAPIGSLYMRTDGRHYRKTGGLDNDWGETDTGGGGGGGFTGLGLWRYRTETTSTPSSGRLQFDNTDVDLATNLYVNALNDSGSDMTTFLSLIKSGDLVYIQDQANAAKHIIAEVGAFTLLSGVFTFPLSMVESEGAAITNNTTVAFVTSHSGSNSGLIIPFFNEDGTQDNIELVDGQIPFFNEDTTQDNIGLV